MNRYLNAGDRLWNSVFLNAADSRCDFLVINAVKENEIAL